MDNFAEMAPFTFDQRLGKVVGVNAKIGGMNPVIDIRSWGYLTGQGHGALGLTQHDAAAEQDAFGELVAELLNKHFKELACHNLAMAILNAGTDIGDGEAGMHAVNAKMQKLENETYADLVARYRVDLDGMEEGE